MYTILYFYTKACSKCRFTGPAIKSAAAYFNTSIQEIDAEDDKHINLVKKYGIMEAPTIVLLKYGVESLSFTGIRSKDSLIQDLHPYLKDNIK